MYNLAYKIKISDKLILLFITFLPEAIFKIGGEYFIINRFIYLSYSFLLFLTFIKILGNFKISYIINFPFNLFFIFAFVGIINGLIRGQELYYLIYDFVIILGIVLGFLYGIFLQTKYHNVVIKYFIHYLAVSSILHSIIILIDFIYSKNPIYISNIHYMPLSIGFIFLKFSLIKKNKYFLRIIYLISILLIIITLIILKKRALLIFSMFFLFYSIFKVRKKLRQLVILALLLIILINILQMENLSNIKNDLLVRFRQLSYYEEPDFEIVRYSFWYIRYFINKEDLINILFGKGCGEKIEYINIKNINVEKMKATDNIYVTIIVKYGIIGFIIFSIILIYIFQYNVRNVKRISDSLQKHLFSNFNLFYFIHLLLTFISSWLLFSFSAIFLWIILGYTYRSMIYNIMKMKKTDL